MQQIYGYIADDSVAAAEAQIARIRNAVERLATFPRSGRMIPRVERDDLRELIVGNYRIGYTLSDDDVVTVHHAARKLPD